MAERPGLCRTCQRRYSDSLFSIDEFIKQNMSGIKFGAQKRHEDVAVAIERSRARHAAWLVERDYENCTRSGCRIAIKPINPGDPDVLQDQA